MKTWEWDKSKRSYSIWKHHNEIIHTQIPALKPTIEKFGFVVFFLNGLSYTTAHFTWYMIFGFLWKVMPALTIRCLSNTDECRISEPPDVCLLISQVIILYSAPFSYTLLFWIEVLNSSFLRLLNHLQKRACFKLIIYFILINVFFDTFIKTCLIRIFEI